MIMVVTYSSFANANLEDGLIAYWSFDDCNAKDMINGHDGILKNNPQCVNALDGKAFYFNGIDQYIEIPFEEDLNLEKYGEFTIFVIANADEENGVYDVDFYDTPNGDPTLLSKDCSSDPTGPYNLYMSSYDHTSSTQRISFEIQNNHNVIKEEDFEWPQTSAGSYHFIVWRHYDDVYEIWIDGKMELQVHSDLEPDSGRNCLLIGRRGWFNGYFKGSIAEVRLYNRALSEVEIEELYSGTQCNDKYDEGYNEGFEAGEEYCKNNPASCGIDIGEQKECPICECSTTTDGCEASFNMSTNTLHVPCLDMGKSYWLDLELINLDPVQLELKGFGVNSEDYEGVTEEQSEKRTDEGILTVDSDSPSPNSLVCSSYEYAVLSHHVYSATLSTTPTISFDNDNGHTGLYYGEGTNLMDVNNNIPLYQDNRDICFDQNYPYSITCKYQWYLIDTWQASNGLFAALYKRLSPATDGVKYALVFRGSEDTDLGDWLNNIFQLLTSPSLVPGQYLNSRDILQQVENYLKNDVGLTQDELKTALVISGHSLGGGLSQFVAAGTQYVTYVFNAAGFSNAIFNDYFGAATDPVLFYKNIYNIILRNKTQIDIVGGTFNHLGKQIHLINKDIICGDGPICDNLHSMLNIISTIQKMCY